MPGSGDHAWVRVSENGSEGQSDRDRDAAMTARFPDVSLIDAGGAGI